MLKNFIKTSVRNLLRERSKTTLNILGLTLGISSSLVLFLLIRHHNSFDTFHEKRDRIYRVVTESNGNSGQDYSTGIPTVLPDAFRNDFPEVEEVTFTSFAQERLVTIPQPSGEPRKFEEERGVVVTQANFFKIFDRKILVGDAEKGLDEPNEAILSRSWAIRYFGKEDATNEVVKVDNNEYRIAAIMEDPSPNTDFPFHLMLSLSTVKTDLEKRGWTSISSDDQCYFTLKEGEKISSIESRMPAFVKKYLGENNRDNQNFLAQPLATIHFDDRFGNYNYNTVSSQMLLSLSVIAVFLVVTACINFINLSTAEAIKRSKEVGIRKALGSTRSQLVSQFLGETTLVAIVAVGLAVVLATASLSFLNPFLELTLSLQASDYVLWIFLAILTIAVSLLSGLYPSFIVSGYNPVAALKNKISSRNTSGYNLRRSLVVLQFFISQFLIIGTIVLVMQTNYFRNKELGFRRDAIVLLPVPVAEQPSPTDSVRPSKMKTLRDEIQRLRGVELASLSNFAPAAGSVNGTGFTVEGKDEFYETQVKTIDGNYLDLFDLKLAAGQNIGDLDTAQGFLVNEKLAAMVGYDDPQEIIGKRIRVFRKTLPVVGVVRNFHTVSLRSPIEATVLMNRIRNYYTLSVKVDPANLQETIGSIKEKWEAAYPDYLFSYDFMDESIREFYESEERTSVLLSVFTSMAIFIGCLGLFGLASFMANQKTKEIGIRKVMGASVENIVFIFSKEFLLLIVVGFLLAMPLSWYVMNQWLNEFAYKIELGPMIFLAGLGATLLIAMITVGYRSVRAATVNPVESLKYE